MKKKFFTVLLAVVLVCSFSLVTAVPAAADGTPTIDGVISPDEWDAHYLGTSVTTWSGGMSVDVYGFADDTYLYAAYEADMTQPGWSDTASMCISANLDYLTPTTAEWPDPGYTHISVYGAGFAQTDGSDWAFPDWGNTDPSEFTNRGIEYYVGEPCYDSPYPNTAEIKIPLSLLTYAGDNHFIGLSGQYWQYDFAEPLLVMLPPSPTTVWVDDDWVALGLGEAADGHTFGYDAFATIQEGIDAVDPGDTVNVAAGRYNENLLIDKALTVKSTDGAKQTIIDGTSTYIVTILHSDVTFEGFTVTNPENEGGGDISGILIGGWNYTPIPENVKILNNIVKQVRSETGIPSTFATTGINVGTSKNVVISGNTITDIKNPGDPVGSSASDHTCGINVWGDTLTGSSRNIVISNNIISDIKYNGIILEGAIDVQIGENDITGCESGVRVKPREGEISNVQIGENDITGCEYGISVVPEAFILSGLTINLNNIAENTEYGVANFDLALSVDATNNWWGATNGPSGQGSGDGDAVSENVLFHPYLENPYEESAAAVSFIATTEEPVIGIEVSPTFINFGAISAGVTVTGDRLTVTNTGNMPMSVSADLTEDTFYSGSNYFYTKALKLNGKDSDYEISPPTLGSWSADALGFTFIPKGEPDFPFPSNHVSTKLVVPEGIILGDTYTGTVVFWAELAH